MGNDKNENIQVRFLKPLEECMRILGGSLKYVEEYNDYLCEIDGKSYVFGVEKFKKVEVLKKLKTATLKKEEQDLVKGYGLGDFVDILGHQMCLPVSFFEDDVKLKLDKLLKDEVE